jgi:hypothetical protein
VRQEQPSFTAHQSLPRHDVLHHRTTVRRHQRPTDHPPPSPPPPSQTRKPRSAAITAVRRRTDARWPVATAQRHVNPSSCASSLLLLPRSHRRVEEGRERIQTRLPQGFERLDPVADLPSRRSPRTAPPEGGRSAAVRRARPPRDQPRSAPGGAWTPAADGCRVVRRCLRRRKVDGEAVRRSGAGWVRRALRRWWRPYAEGYGDDIFPSRNTSYRYVRSGSEAVVARLPADAIAIGVTNAQWYGYEPSEPDSGREEICSRCPRGLGQVPT